MNAKKCTFYFFLGYFFGVNLEFENPACVKEMKNIAYEMVYSFSSFSHLIVFSFSPGGIFFLIRWFTLVRRKFTPTVGVMWKQLKIRPTYHHQVYSSKDCKHKQKMKSHKEMILPPTYHHQVYSSSPM